MKTLLQINGMIARFLFQIANIASFGILTITGVNVFFRYILNAPFYWAEEVTCILLVLLSLFPAAEILNRGQHIHLEILRRFVPERVWGVFEALIYFMGMVFTAVLTWQTFSATHLVYSRDMREPSLLSSPLWIPYSFMFVSSAALFLTFFVKFWGKIVKKGEP